jgi:hypothetical protein
MQIAGCHSHLGGLEFLKIQKPVLWNQIEDIVQSAETNTDASAEVGETLSNAFRRQRWSEQRVDDATREARHLLKERVGVAVHFGARGVGPYDLFSKHMAFYVGDVIDVGLEILPMKQLQAQMSSGVAYYESELYNLIREGRCVPAVPLVLIGVAP